MEQIDGIVGNVHADAELAALRAEHADAGTLERVVIDAGRRRRSRFREMTDAGTDVGVVVDSAAISAGDVLLVDDERMIVVAFEPREALAVTLPEATPQTLEAAVELGHRVGNQHWDLAVEDGIAYVPLEADQHIVERVVTDVIPGASVEAVTVEAELFVSDGAETVPDHEHEHGGADHAHGDGGHSHTHGHGDHSHSHEHEHAHGDADHSHSRGHEHRHTDTTDHSHPHDHDH
ncbi:urease accessory protein UreE [Natronolimnobius sp. AArcel1]|uniref:urease accessory protein UreE n=1 Tax=Natronolimnobius sp. AArcel1 TaxID=1679093 RepID=UPI0013EA3FB3|nr:urease accessory protein UreE [Natronolimnobius sp. AArcel1]NGM68955.1 urease accessory protein UreE [Natronolimnobius sp. AArcel1]